MRIAFLSFLMVLLAQSVFAQAASTQAVVPIPQPRIARDGETPVTQNQDQPPTSLDGQTGLTIVSSHGSATPNIPGPPQPISLSATIEENGTVIPSGLIWRVYDAKTDETGQLTQLFKSEDATASLSLPPGEYRVHVSLGRAQTTDILQVQIGPNIKTLVLDAGALKLRSEITSEIFIPPNQLKFDVFTDGIDGEQIPIITNVEQNALIHLNAGVYSVVSRWGNQNATVRADIRVELGQVTEATLFHKAAQVSFLLVSSVGGEAIADVDWKVQNQSNEILFTHLGAFPTAILAEGDYTIIAQSGNTVYNREFQVQTGRPMEIEVLTTVY